MVALKKIDLMHEIVRALVDDPDKVNIEERGEGTRTVFYLIDVAPEDRGKVIGKNGSTIGILRDLLSRIVAKEGRRVIIEVVDPNRNFKEDYADDFDDPDEDSGSARRTSTARKP